MSFYESAIRPLLFKIPAETAHESGINALRVGLGSGFARNLVRRKFVPDPVCRTELFGLKFASPLGIAAGFDKNGIVVNQLAALGFGFVEVGTVTFEPQPGNEKPRMFRLPADRALINRLGFNNDGTPAVVRRLKRLNRECVLGINIGKNKDVPNEEAVENYLKSFNLAHPVADYIAVNVSSPNTPNLRELQKADNLDDLLRSLQKRNKELGKKPLLVKIAPDLVTAELEAVAGIAVDLGLSGIIATNTTIARTGLKNDIDETGGLSGKPLAEMSTRIISKLFELTGGKLPIIGVGGVFTADDAFEKIAAGASLIQAYTGFVYGGFSFANTVNRGLSNILKDRGFDRISDAVGCGR